MHSIKRNQRKKRTREFWIRHIQKCIESGLTQKEYCFQNGLGPKSMIYWKSKLKKESKEVTFFPVPLSPQCSQPEISSSAPLKLICNNHYKIEVGDSFSPDTLTKLVRVIERL